MLRRAWRERRRTVLAAGAAVLGVLVLVGLLAALRVVRAADRLDDARGLLTSAERALEEGRLGAALDQVTEAQRLLTSATGDLHGAPELSAIGWLPIVSPNLAELRDGVRLALTLADGARRILVDAGPLQTASGSLEVPLRSGAIPLDAVEQVSRNVSALRAALPAPGELPERGGLLGPVRDARDELHEQVGRRRSQLDGLADALDLVHELAGGNGPRRFLIAVANTAEMRGAGGMILNYGVLTGTDGRFALTQFGRVDELELVEPAAVPGLDEGYLRRWSGFDPLLRWRNATMAADFTLVAPVLEAMFLEATGLEADGVIQIDPSGLAAILAGTGPVQVGELGQVTSENVVDLVLSEAYQRYPDIESRSDVLGDVAEAAFRKLVTGDYPSVRGLAEGLAAAVRGRHVLVHSRYSDVQSTVVSLGASGALPEPTHLDHVHLTAQNVSANKLDYYVDTELTITGTRRPGEIGRLRAEVTLRNTAPPGVTEPRYVFGPFDTEQVAGEYRSVVTLYLPAGTSLEGAGGGPVVNQPIAVPEDGRVAVSWWVNIPAGESNTVVLDLVLPPRPERPYEMVAVPSPRVRPTTLSVDVDTGAGRLTGEEVLDHVAVLRSAP